MDKEEISTQMVRKTNPSKMLDMDDNCIQPLSLRRDGLPKVKFIPRTKFFHLYGLMFVIICQSYSIRRNTLPYL